MAEDKEYIIIDEGNSIVTALSQKYPKELFAVDPERVIVLGISNKERPSRMKKLAMIHMISSAMKTIIRSLAQKEVEFYIEIYCSDFLTWNDTRRQWIIFHELIHVPRQGKSSLIQHDTEDFAGILDAVGVDWWSRDDLPNLLSEEPFQFRNALFSRLHSEE